MAIPQDLAYSAMAFAMDVHATQKRRYTGEPYAVHLAEVAGLALPVLLAGSYGYLTADVVRVFSSVCWLHDCMEDQGVLFDTLRAKFGYAVAEGVRWLTDCEVGNRASRKEQAAQRLARAPDWVQTIKCADLISNTQSIVLHDPGFAVTYLREKKALLEAMTQADPKLRERAAQDW
jgi:(p)ppGpp synthase/HD superfamily hydrolase